MQSSVRILVLESFELFQQLLAPILQQRQDWKVIGIVRDEVDAVRLARQLQPDLVVLDIDFQRMNGLKAARQVRTVSRDSKLVFISEESSAGVVREAFRFGASAYVLKQYLSSDLLAAIDAILQEKHFIGRGISDLSFHGIIESNDLLHTPTGFANTRKPQVVPYHEVQFYSEDSILLDRLTDFIEASLKKGHAAILCASASWRHSVQNVLRARGVDLDELTEQGTFITQGASETLSTFMDSDFPDRTRFLVELGRVITQAGDTARGNSPRVALYQECAPLLWSQGKEEATVRLEGLYNELVSHYDVDILCGYSLDYFDDQEDTHLIQRICAEHSAVDSR